MRFSSKTAKTTRKTVNRAGGPAYKASDKFQLFSLLATSFLKDQFYRSANQTLNELIQLVDKNDPQFAAKCAIYIRNEFGMRSVSHVVAGEIAKNVKGASWTRNFFPKVVKRPDDAVEILAYYLTMYGKPIPNSMKKGLGQALSKFDDYQIGKYKCEGHDLSLVDAVNLLHPGHTGALAKLINGTLESPDTWEVGLTEAGTKDNKEQAKKEVWLNLLKTKKIGYFALLRNLRNIIQQAPEATPLACEMLTDEKLIKKSLVLPFRYWSAHKELAQISGSREVMEALSKAAEIALSNVPKLDGKTLIAIDVSGSMGGQPSDIASMFGAMLYKTNNADIMLFDTSSSWFSPNPKSDILSIVSAMRNEFRGGGTDFSLIFKAAKEKYDRVVILSDMQPWVQYHTPVSDLNKYKARTGANPMVYSIDLQGYGTLQFPETQICHLTGWSEKIFEIMKIMESDRTALIKAIESIEL